MTLDEAIEHAKEEGLKMCLKCETRECGREYLQLAKWLSELKAYKKVYALPQENVLV